MTEAMELCGCSEEYGPCEDHCQVLVQREGASLRTADELQSLYLDDALDIDPECLSAEGRDIRRQVKAKLAEEVEAGFSHWLDDPDLADSLGHLVTQVESYLSPLQTYWDDGYRIVKITGGPFAELEE